MGLGRSPCAITACSSVIRNRWLGGEHPGLHLLSKCRSIMLASSLAYVVHPCDWHCMPTPSSPRPHSYPCGQHQCCDMARKMFHSSWWVCSDGPQHTELWPSQTCCQWPPLTYCDLTWHQVWWAQGDLGHHLHMWMGQHMHWHKSPLWGVIALC